MTYLTNRTDVLNHAQQIAAQYQAQGLGLTVRQLYYQFVARGLLPSGQNEYKKIVDTLSKARYAGKFDNDLIEDRTRTVHKGSFTRNDDNVFRGLDSAAEWIRQMPNWALDRDRWYGQSTHVSVWVEKEALAGIFETTCNALGVSWLACKGCPSVSALWDWVKGARDAKQHGGGDQEWKESIILYFGDHDPTGFMIPRAAHEGIEKLQRAETKDMNEEELLDWEDEKELMVTVKRVALNMDQVQQYNPPPFWAKTSDTRYKGYVREHGTTDAWELDALDPPVLRSLIESEVNKHFDHEVYEENQEVIQDKRDEMREKMRSPEWIAEVLGGE
jgi:hypothetical protein